MYDGMNFYNRTATSGAINVVCSAKDNAGILYFGSYTDGLFKYNGTTWIKYTSSNSAMSNTNLTELACDASNNVWVATQNGFNKFDGTNWTLYNSTNTPFPTNNYPSVAIEPTTQKVWLGSTEGQAGILNTSTNTWQLYQVYVNSSFANTRNISDIAVDALNQKWFCTVDSGVYFLNPTTHTTQLATQNTNQISIFQNPAKNNTTLRFSTPSTTPSTITVTNTLGQNLITQNLPNTLNPILIDLQKLAPGNYFVTIKTNQNTSTQKLIITQE
jgi:ligand-binding sensor domain-containing protein